MNISSATLKVALASSATNTLDLSTPADALNITETMSFTNGDGADEANQHWHDKRSLASGASEELDLAGTLTDGFGDTVTFTNVKALYIKNNSTESTLIVGGAAANAFGSFFANDNDKLVIRPGGDVLLRAPDADGYTVTAGTGDKLKIEHGADDTVALTYDIVILGVV